MIDARGLVVMPGGVDMHCHIVGFQGQHRAKNVPRTKTPRPPLHRTGLRSGTMGSVPSTFATGYRYAGLGYTTAFDAAIPPSGGPPCSSRVRGHALYRQGLLYTDGQ